MAPGQTGSSFLLFWVWLLCDVYRTKCFMMTKAPSRCILRNLSHVRAIRIVYGHERKMSLHSAAPNDRGDVFVGVQVVSLDALGDDHESVGENMARSVTAWLDSEWMPQNIHIQMGTSVKATYVYCRKNEMSDVSEIMTQVTDDLYAKWSEYNADSFVSAWDIGNYVADYLIAKSGSETCGCSTKIVD